MNVNYRSELATAIRTTWRPRPYTVGEIITQNNIGFSWCGYEKEGTKRFEIPEHGKGEDKYNYAFAVKDINVYAVNYLNEIEVKSITDHNECEVRMPSDYRFEVVDTTTHGHVDDNDTYEAVYDRMCRQVAGYETITLKILNNQEIEEEFDLESMIDEIEEKLEELF